MRKVIFRPPQLADHDLPQTDSKKIGWLVQIWFLHPIKITIFFWGGNNLFNQWVFYLIFNKTHVYFCQITWGELRFLYGSNLGHQTRTAGHLEKMWETSSILVPSWKHAEKPSILGVYYYSYIYIYIYYLVSLQHVKASVYGECWPIPSHCSDLHTPLSRSRWCDLGKDQEEQDDQCPRTWLMEGQSPRLADSLF